MAYLLGVDTGGTYTDAVVLDTGSDQIIGKAKALTTRPELSNGVGAAIDAAIADAGVNPSDIAMVSLSTTLATNALVEGQGGRVACVAIGFDAADLTRAGLEDALHGDPVLRIAGGHNHSGAEAAPLDLDGLRKQLAVLEDGVTGFAVAAQFATRNPAHELAARDLIRDLTGKPVTCAHELSQSLGGPKRALTAVLNARLIGMIDRLITACEGHLKRIGVTARLMVVRGDGALVAADVARVKPIETILSGPAASIAGASWLSGVSDALVSDIGGTTTDICLLRDGRPKIDPQGARVGPYRTMVEAVAMRTWGLGGDSQVHLRDGLDGGVVLGPRRVMPVSLAAMQFPELVHQALDRALAHDRPAMDGGQFVIPLWQDAPSGLGKRESAIVARLAHGPLRLGDAIQSRIENPALGRLIAQGQVALAGVTPSDAAHVLGLTDAWDSDAAMKALTLFARQRTGAGTLLATDAKAIAEAIIVRLQAQTAAALLESAFAEDDRDWPDPASLASHPLALAGLDRHQGVVQTRLSLGVPVIGLGASAATYYGAVGDRLGTQMILPELGGVANAIGAVVGQVRMQATGTVSSAGEGVFVAHLPDGPETFTTRDAALDRMETHLRQEAEARVRASGVDDINISVSREIAEVPVENRTMFIEAVLRVEASGRPRIAD